MEFFGGEKAFTETIKRDEEKRAKAKRLNIGLIYVEPGYDLDQVVAQITGASTSA